MSSTKYDQIGHGYNTTRQADDFIAQRLFDLLKPHPEKDQLYLDIGCGTGNYTIALTEMGANFVGVDPSDKMLELARTKSQKTNWLKGTADQIQVSNGTFSGAIATLTIHHWEELALGFKEMARVLKADGKFILFTSTPTQMKGYWLNHYFPKMLSDSINQMPSMEQIETAMSATGFIIEESEKYFVKDDLKDHFLYGGKNKPQNYFNEDIRNGISSFSTLANAQEVNQGLTKLAEDLRNGRFKEIQGKYLNDMGDYLFISAVKTGCSKLND